MNVEGFKYKQSAEEIRLALERLKGALFDGLQDEIGEEQRKACVRKAYGYAEVIAEHVSAIRTIAV